jgi:hypothetical protein
LLQVERAGIEPLAADLDRVQAILDGDKPKSAASVRSAFCGRAPRLSSSTRC